MTYNSVQIVKIEGSKFIFDNKIFQEIIDKNIDTKDLPVSIIVINGALRTGKSFFNNFFIRYLTNDNGETLVNHFNSKRGANAQTLGIWMFDKIFIHDNKAIILLDTQGIFDQDLNQAMTIALISLSTILSNYQIYNLDKRIQEDHLCNIAYFSAYSSLISQRSKINDTLCFLIRDWQNFSNVNNLSLCDDESTNYKNEYFNNNNLDQNKKETRDKIINTFNNIDVKLCPHPGYAVTEQSFNGNISDIRPEFIFHVNHIIKNILNEIKIKKMNDGTQLLCRELPNYMQMYISLYEDIKDKLPEPLTILETTEKICRENSKTKTIHHYRNSMLMKIQQNDMTKDEIETCHNICLPLSMEYFDSLIIIGDKNYVSVLRNEIVKIINSEYESFILMAKERSLFNFIMYYVDTLKQYINFDLLNFSLIKNILSVLCIFFILFSFPFIMDTLFSIIKYAIILSFATYFCLQIANATNDKKITIK